MFGDIRDSVFMQKAYGQANFKIQDNSESCENTCIIFFSSNAIYYPNTEAELKKAVQKDRFEWENISQSPILKRKVKRYIFVRDLYKQWYISGINSDVNSIDKLIELLADLTSGYRVITVGSSAGGYAAVLFGVLLKAEKVFCFAGQWDISEQCGNNPFVDGAIQNRYQYIKIADLVKNSRTPVFYMWPLHSDWDAKQAENVLKNGNVISFAFNASDHGVCCYSFNIPDLIVKDVDTLKKLGSIKKIHGWKKVSFLLQSVGLGKGIYKFLKNLLQRLVSKIVKKS